MRANRGRDTKPEVRLRSALHRRGIRFRKHSQPVPGVRCKADVVFSKARLAVFIDGCFWHGCPEHGTKPKTNGSYWSAKLARNSERDRSNDEALHGAGWRVIRVWEHEDAEKAADRISKELMVIP